MDPGHELAAQVVLDMAQHRDAAALDVGVVVVKAEGNGLGLDAELGVEVVEGRAVGIEDHPLERPHAQMLQRDGVLVAHGLEVIGHDVGQRLGLVLRAEGANTLDFLGQHHVVVRDMRDVEAAELAFAALADGAGRAYGEGRQQVQNPVLLLDGDLAEAHRPRRHQHHALQPSIAVGQDVDGRGQRRHVEGGGIEGIIHGHGRTPPAPAEPGRSVRVAIGVESGAQAALRTRMPRASRSAIAAALAASLMPSGQTIARSARTASRRIAVTSASSPSGAVTS